MSKPFLAKSLLFSLVFILPLSLSNSAKAINDKYSNFNELKLSEVEGVDYKICSSDTYSDIAVIAIHGGKIERGTTELAQALASKGTYDYYSFAGIKKSDNLSLHISSTNFDEPIAIHLVANSRKTISLHGCSGTSKVTYIGGLDSELGQKIKKNLEATGFFVDNAPPNISGVKTSNIANRNLSGMGVQLELTKGLRDSFFATNGATNDLFEQYIIALKQAINS